MTTFSHSKIEKFETCRLQYKYAYIDRVEVERKNTIEAFLGSCVHDSLEELYTALRYEKTMTLKDLIADFNRRWEKEWDESIVIVKKDYNQDNYRLMGEKYLRNYFRRHHPFREGNILGLETQDFLDLDPEGKYKYHVRIDRLMELGDGVYEVHDYKTNMKLPSQDDLNKDRQLAMYSLWVRERFTDFKKVRLVWHFLAFDKEMDSFRTREQLEELRSAVLGQIKTIESTGEFPAEKSILCSWCLYRDICPEWKHEVQLEAKEENEYLSDDGLKLVDEYVRIKSELKEYSDATKDKLGKLEEALVAFANKESMSTIFGSDKKVSIKKTESVKFPAKNSPERIQLTEYLKSTGKWEDVSDLDTFALQRRLQGKDWNEEIRSRVEQFGEKEAKYRFSVGKKD